MKFKALLFSLLPTAIFCSTSYADSAKTIELSISSSVPPYNMLEEDVVGHPGIQIEIVNLALKRLGIDVKWRNMTNNRALKELAAKRIDGALNVSTFIDDGPDQYHSSVNIINFQNCLIGSSSLLASGQKFDDFFEELMSKKELKMMGFQGASKVFKEVLKDLKSYPKYEEVPHQKILAASFDKGRTHLVLSDYLVFQYYMKKIHEERSKVETPHTHNYICLKEVPSAPRAITFRSKELRNKFDVEIKKIINSGEKEKIVTKYKMFLTEFLKERTSLLFNPTQVSFYDNAFNSSR